MVVWSAPPYPSCVSTIDGYGSERGRKRHAPLSSRIQPSSQERSALSDKIEQQEPCSAFRVVFVHRGCEREEEADAGEDSAGAEEDGEIAARAHVGE